MSSLSLQSGTLNNFHPPHSTTTSHANKCDQVSEISRHSTSPKHCFHCNFDMATHFSHVPVHFSQYSDQVMDDQKIRAWFTIDVFNFFAIMSRPVMWPLQHSEDSLPFECSSWDMKLTSYLHVVPESWMQGTLLPLILKPASNAA